MRNKVILKDNNSITKENLGKNYKNKWNRIKKLEKFGKINKK